KPHRPAEPTPRSRLRPFSRRVVPKAVTRYSHPAVDDRLLLGVLVESFGCVLLPEARLLGAAERKLIVSDLQRIDPRVASLQLVHRASRRGHARRPDR